MTMNRLQTSFVSDATVDAIGKRGKSKWECDMGENGASLALNDDNLRIQLHENQKQQAYDVSITVSVNISLKTSWAESFHTSDWGNRTQSGLHSGLTTTNTSTPLRNQTNRITSTQTRTKRMRNATNILHLPIPLKTNKDIRKTHTVKAQPPPTANSLTEGLMATTLQTEQT